MRKLLVLLALVGFGMTGTIGCGDKADPPAPANPTPDPDPATPAE